MKLWIRSQDRKNLVKVFDVFVEDDCLVANYQSHYGGCNYTNIGEYNSNVRALEVLDEIQKFIEEFNTVTAELDEYGDVTNVEHHKKVYQMPNE